MKLACSVAALVVLSAAFTIIHADPADDARAEKERAAKQAAEDKKRAAEDARRAEEARKSGENARPVMVNNRFINPMTGKEVGVYKGGSTYNPAEPGELENWFWLYAAGDSNIRILVDVDTQQSPVLLESPFKVEGKKLSRTSGVYVHIKGEEGRRESEAEQGDPWSCELPGRVLNDKSPWYSENESQLYVAYEGGVARINNLTGKIEWKSPGASGRLYPWNEYLYSAGDNGHGQTELCARKYDSGEIAWTQSLGAGVDAMFMDVHEAMLPGDKKAQYTLSIKNAGEGPATRWFSTDGKLLMSIPECAERVIYDNDRLYVLSDKRFAQINRDGSPVWEVARAADGFDADQWIFKGSGIIRFQWCPFSDDGVKVEYRDYGSAKPAWTHECEGLGVEHSKYWQHVYAQIREDKLVVVSQGASGNFIEVLDVRNGNQIARHKP